jgi:hypothetical protein
MLKRVFFFIFLATIFTMVATVSAQTGNRRAPVSAITPEVRDLMREADKEVTRSRGNRNRAQEKLEEAYQRLLKLGIRGDDHESSAAQADYRCAIEVALRARAEAASAVDRAGVAYLVSHMKILGAGQEPAPDNFNEWQRKAYSLAGFKPVVDQVNFRLLARK